jgi:hypothetical protein
LEEGYEKHNKLKINKFLRKKEQGFVTDLNIHITFVAVVG